MLPLQIQVLQLAKGHQQLWDASCTNRSTPMTPSSGRAGLSGRNLTWAIWLPLTMAFLFFPSFAGSRLPFSPECLVICLLLLPACCTPSLLAVPFPVCYSHTCLLFTFLPAVQYHPCCIRAKYGSDILDCISCFVLFLFFCFSCTVLLLGGDQHVHQAQQHSNKQPWSSCNLQLSRARNMFFFGTFVHSCWHIRPKLPLICRYNFMILTALSCLFFLHDLM